MASRADIARHPIHPMLVPFPIALWIFSLASDLIYLFGFGGPLWKHIALYSMIGGVAGALAAAIPGYVDYRMLTDPQTVRIAWWHMAINLSLALLFVINVVLRLETGPEALVPVLLSLIGVGALGISGWLGGELVYVRGVGVEGRQPPSKPTTRQRAA